jgi:single-strand DNA-binding protein
MNSLNLIGRLTKDPERVTSDSNPELALVRLRVAFDHSGDHVGYIDVAVWDKQALAVEKFLHQGDQVGVSGQLTWSEWETDGQTRSALQVSATRLDFLRKKGDRHDAEAPPVV